MNLHTVICIGSNVERKQLNVAEIVAQLATMFEHFRASDIYENADDSGLGNPYANAVCCGDYDGDYDSLAAFAAQREAMYGRTPQSKVSGVMPLDIDIVVSTTALSTLLSSIKTISAKATHNSPPTLRYAHLCPSNNSKAARRHLHLPRARRKWHPRPDPGTVCWYRSEASAIIPVWWNL